MNNPDTIENDVMVVKWLEYEPKFRELVISVIRSLPTRIENMDEAIRNNDVDAFIMLIHSLKGTSGNFHMDELYHLSCEITNFAKEDGLRSEQLLSRYDEMKSLIKQIPATYYELENRELDQTRNSGQKHRLKVLIAEDDAQNRELIIRMLKDKPLDFEMAENGLVTLEKVYVQTYDVLILDIQMPILDGMEVLQTLKENGTNEKLYIIVLTAQTRAEDIEKFISLGARRYINKPIDKKILRDILDEVIQSKKIQ